MKTFRHYYKFREEGMENGAVDIPTTNGDDDSPQNDDNSLMHNLMSLLWTKYRNKIEPMVQEIAGNDDEVSNFYEQLKNNPDEAMKASRRPLPDNMSGLGGNDKVKMPSADSQTSGEGQAF